MFGDFYRKRRVFVTGHTGFKGSWLCQWLLAEGAEVTGYALAPNTQPALFSLLGLEKHIHHIEADVRDSSRLAAELAQAKPDIVLHLAAQPLVRRSYKEPRLTWETNVLGTVNVLEAVRTCSAVQACVVVTSDKCYENREWVWGYRENEAMGGHDPYSSSKGAAELAVASWQRSFPGGARLASARAGNVIGGGDWSDDRIVTDFVRAIENNRPVQLRNPRATRPWQHVLEPLSGYLLLAQRLCQQDGQHFAEAWNFGPGDDAITTVETLARLLVTHWGKGSVETLARVDQPHEANLLTLDCTKARSRLGWQGRWDIIETAKRTAQWYKRHQEGEAALHLMNADLQAYSTAVIKGIAP